MFEGIMVEKKMTTSTAAKKATQQKTVSKKTTTSVDLSPENIGFKAGDVYNALAAAEIALSVNEIAKTAKISTEEAYLGIGWLSKEGKVKGEANKIELA